MIDLESKDLIDYLETNLFGPHELIRSIFRLLKQSKGKIINISSLSGLVIPSFRGGYNLSKWALEVYSEQLRLELQTFDIDVILIEPRIVNTGIFDKLDKIYEKRIEKTELFKEELQKSREEMQKYIKKHGKSADKIANRVLEALSSQKPNFHYIVADKEEQRLVAKLLIHRLWEIISGFTDQWNKQELIAILSEAIENREKF